MSRKFHAGYTQAGYTQAGYAQAGNPQAVFPAAAGPASHVEAVRAFFLVTAPADPNLLPRLIEPVAKLGATPLRVHASREDGDGSELSVDLRLDGVSARTAQLIEYALRAVVGVRHVVARIEPDVPVQAVA